MLAVEKLGSGAVERSIALGVKSQRLDEFALGVNGVLGQKRPTARCKSECPGRRSRLREALESGARDAGLFIETGSDAGLHEVRREHECDVWLANSRWRCPQLLQLSRGDFGSAAGKINEGQPPPRDRVCDGHAGLSRLRS